MTRLQLSDSDFWIRWSNNTPFEEVELTDFCLDDIDMSSWLFKNSSVRRMSFTDTDMKDTTWIDCDLEAVTFHKCDFTNARFINVKASQIEFTECKLQGVVFRENVFTNLYMFGCDGLITFHSQACSGKIMDCDFESSCFDYADLTNTYFWDCILDSGSFFKAYLNDASFNNCTITNCEFFAATSCKNTDFSTSIINPVEPTAPRLVSAQSWVQISKAPPPSKAAVLICSNESQLVV